MIVCGSIVIASYFVYIAASDFNKTKVVTTIKSTTGSLDQVYFPSVTICNINQVRESFFLDMDLDPRDNQSLIDLLYRQFYSGSDEKAQSEADQDLVKNFLNSDKYVKAEFNYYNQTIGGTRKYQKEIKDHKSYRSQFSKLIEKGAQFTRLAVQEPLGHMILRASFGNRTKPGTSKDFMPHFGKIVFLILLLFGAFNYRDRLRDLQHHQASDRVRPEPGGNVFQKQNIWGAHQHQKGGGGRQEEWTLISA